MLALTALAACQPKTEKVPAIDMTDLDLTVAPGGEPPAQRSLPGGRLAARSVGAAGASAARKPKIACRFFGGLRIFVYIRIYKGHICIH